VLAIDRSEFLYNKAVVGGAIHWRTWPSTVILTQSNFYANRAVNSSAISILAIGEIQHCNFSYNLAEEYGIVSLERKGSVSFVSCKYVNLTHSLTHSLTLIHSFTHSSIHSFTCLASHAMSLVSSVATKAC